MVSVEYSEAAVEVLDILKYTRESDVEKIPKKFIKFLEENSSKTYEPNLDHSKPIKEMGLKQKTQDILGVIYLKYWADEQGKEKFRAKIKEKESKYQEELKEKYNTDNLFKQRVNEEIKPAEEMQLQIVQKETFIQKMINTIKRIFRR